MWWLGQGRRGLALCPTVALGLITLCAVYATQDKAQQHSANGPAQVAVVRFEKTDYLFPRDERNVAVTIAREGADLSSQATVWCNTRPSDPISAIPDKDFVKRSSKVIFQPGQTSATCMVSLLSDDVSWSESGPAKLLTVTLSSVTNATIVQPSQATVTILAENNGGGGPVLQFVNAETTVLESAGVAQVAVMRDGQLDTFVSVLCTTHARTAIAGEDYVERPPRDQSVLVLAPGQRLAPCSVTVLDDRRRESSSETLELRLSQVESSGRRPASIGPNATAILRITDNDNDDDDLDYVGFEQPSYRVSEPSASQQVTTVLINVVRRGSSNTTGNSELRVRVSTRDGLAVAGVDYNPKSALLTFGPTDTVRPFEVELLHSPEHAFRQRAFQVVLSSGDQDVGVRRHQGAQFALVTVLDSNQDGAVVLPVAPIVMSLWRYDHQAPGTTHEDTGASTNQASASYPLVCVSPCDDRFPDAAAVRVCRDLAVPETHFLYSWEVSDQLDESSGFVPLKTATLMAPVDARLLDSIYYRVGYRVRCSVRLLDDDSDGGSSGVALRSEPVTISSQNGVCGSVANVDGLQSQPFVASLQYVDWRWQKSNPNRLRIRVEIPHHDGMIPLVSTFSLDNVPLLLTDAFYRKHHVCSNLLFPEERQALLGGGFLKDWSQLDADAATTDSPSAEYPHEFDADLRGNRTVLFYRHLNLKRCLWTFEATYHVTELVDLCGGHLTSDPQTDWLTKGSLTIRVPLHVTMVVTTGAGRWASLEHGTQLDLSLAYDTVAWHSALHTAPASPLPAHLRVLRILLTANGQLVLEFETRAKFRGLFVLEHHAMPQYRSRVVPPNLITLSFNLTLVRSASTYDGPTQVWRAVSNYSLKDYSGEYVVELMPCTVTSDQAYSNGSGVGGGGTLACTPHAPQQFALPISFHQVKRPVPVQYTLNAHLHVTNNQHHFLSSAEQELLSATNQLDHRTTFAKGEKLFGKVMWGEQQQQQGQQAHPYRLRIQQVYVCCGLDGHAPVYDPSGAHYQRGPQWGCIRPDRRLRHRLLLLDRQRREVHHHSDSSGGGIREMALPVRAMFAEEDERLRAIHDQPGVDGFVILVDGLFNLDAGYQWFLQVVFTIEPSTPHSSRHKRQSVVMTSLNGTDMLPITLTTSATGQPNFSYLRSSSATPLLLTISTAAILSALILAGIAITYYRRHWLRPGHSIITAASTNNQRRLGDVTAAAARGGEGCFPIGCGGHVQVVAKFGQSRSSCVVLARSPSPPFAQLLTNSDDVTEV